MKVCVGGVGVWMILKAHDWQPRKIFEHEEICFNVFY